MNDINNIGLRKGDWVVLESDHNRVGIVARGGGDYPVGVLFVGEAEVGDNFYDPSDLVKVSAHSHDDIARLKQNWDHDPVFEIEDVEGYEANRAELLEYHLNSLTAAYAALRNKYYATAEGRLEILERRLADNDHA